MNKPVAVSVVIPFWNAGTFLREAVDSVLAQTLPAWELLLVDDGSTDRSSAIAQEYARRQPHRIRYLEHEGHQNRGVAASRNRGVREARGEYVAFLDADDAWLPRKLEEQLAILEAEPEAALVCGPSQLWYSWTGRPQDAHRDRVKDLRVPPGLTRPPALLVSSLARGTFVANPSTILMRRAALERVGGFEEGFVGPLQTCEDSAFLAKVHLNESVFVATECWARYRQHEDSLFATMTRTGRTRATRLGYFEWLSSYLTQQAVDSPAIWAAFAEGLWPYRHPVRHAAASALKSALRCMLPRRVRGYLLERWRYREEG
jgi:glycosyltransferase involved in cell wall biosynthesis